MSDVEAARARGHHFYVLKSVLPDWSPAEAMVIEHITMLSPGHMNLRVLLSFKDIYCHFLRLIEHFTQHSKISNISIWKIYVIRSVEDLGFN